jgi:uncharacterized UPF0160 family protein
MFHLIYRILRGIILLPVAVVLMTLLNNYDDSQVKHVEYNETIIDTQNIMEDIGGAYDRN